MNAGVEHESYKAQVTKAEHQSLDLRRKPWGNNQEKSVSVFTTVVQIHDTGLRVYTLMYINNWYAVKSNIISKYWKQLKYVYTREK